MKYLVRSLLIGIRVCTNMEELDISRNFTYKCFYYCLCEKLTGEKLNGPDLEFMLIWQYVSWLYK
jgi:hypothetical protein